MRAGAQGVVAVSGRLGVLRLREVSGIVRGVCLYTLLEQILIMRRQSLYNLWHHWG